MSAQPSNLPYWPRMMKRAKAAAYCDMSVSAFEGEVLAGRLPTATVLGGRDHWCRNALDRALDSIAGTHGDKPEWERKLEKRYG